MARKPRTTWPRNAEYRQRKYQKRVSRIRGLVRELKHKTPCADCGVAYPYYVMDFDHRDPAAKSFDVSRAMCNLTRLLDEVAKCDLVCANCHREREYQRRVLRSNQ